MTYSVPVALAGQAYEVLIGRGLIDQAAQRLRPFLRRAFVAVVMDETVREVWGDDLLDGLALEGIRAEPIVIPPGEQEKSFARLEELCDRLLALEVERGDLIVALGGGVVGDLAGFAAAILKRGVDFVQIPTTLLAQVDSSVGGKTAIDTPRGKNLVGAFHQPRLVLADLAALHTLPQRELVCGLAEVIKYGLLGDAAFFHWLESALPALLAREETALARAIVRSVEMKAAIVAEDERERGVRALLNLGHTFAHAIEAETGFGEELKHGEAVGLGCALAFRLSAAQGLCAPAEAQRVAKALGAAGLPTRLDDVTGRVFDAETLIGHMRQDKKASEGEITLILARGIGEAFVARGVDPRLLRAFLVAEGAAP